MSDKRKVGICGICGKEVEEGVVNATQFNGVWVCGTGCNMKMAWKRNFLKPSDWEELLAKQKQWEATREIQSQNTETSSKPISPDNAPQKNPSRKLGCFTLAVIILTIVAISVALTPSSTPTTIPTPIKIPTVVPAELTNEELQRLNEVMAELNDDPEALQAAINALSSTYSTIATTPIITPIFIPTPTPGIGFCYSFELDQWISYTQATVICNDGTCSLSTGPGTCSYHGGIKIRLNQ